MKRPIDLRDRQRHPAHRVIHFLFGCKATRPVSTDHPRDSRRVAVRKPGLLIEPIGLIRARAKRAVGLLGLFEQRLQFVLFGGEDHCVMAPARFLVIDR